MIWSRPELRLIFAAALAAALYVLAVAWWPADRTDTAGALERLDINCAEAHQMEALPGMTPALAAAIVAHRKYASVDDLAGVPGIDLEMLEQWKPFIVAEKTPKCREADNDD